MAPSLSVIGRALQEVVQLGVNGNSQAFCSVVRMVSR